MRHLTDKELIADVRHTYADDHLMRDMADRLEKALDALPVVDTIYNSVDVGWDLQGVADKIREALDACNEMEHRLKGE